MFLKKCGLYSLIYVDGNRGWSLKLWILESSVVGLGKYINFIIEIILDVVGEWVCMYILMVVYYR